MAKPWKTTARVIRRVKVPRDGGGFTTREEHLTVPLEIEINWTAIAELLGQKAFANRSGKSRALAGLITARAKKDKATPI